MSTKPPEGLIECIPNFSCSGSGAVGALVAAAAGAPGVTVLGASSNADHNRAVLTLAGCREGISEAAFLLCKTARDNIDLRRHTGVHPRIGATDVIPFVPLRGSTMEDCIGISKAVGKRIADELAIPVFLYEAAASAPGRKNLAEIRKGGFEGMLKKMLLDGWQPDFGEGRPHPTAGVTAIGARRPLIAFNVYLATGDVTVAKKIAAAIREANGGLAGLKAIGVYIGEAGAAQVSMNITDYRKTSVKAAFDAVKDEAGRYKTAVRHSELIGFAPAGALDADVAEYVGLRDFCYERCVIDLF